VAEKKDDTFDFGFSAKKDKKKKKGGVFSFEEVEETPEAAPAVVEETPAEDDWASFATAGKKGKGKKAKGKTAVEEAPKVCVYRSYHFRLSFHLCCSFSTFHAKSLVRVACLICDIWWIHLGSSRSGAPSVRSHCRLT